MKTPWLIASVFLFTSIFAPVAAAQPATLPLQERAALVDRILEERVQTVLPELMRRNGIDMWLVISREYNEDPIIKTMLPSTWMAARRRTILLMFDPGGDQPIETLAVARYNVGKLFKKAWDKESQPDQWSRLVELIEQRDPNKIAINQSERYGLADGINATELNLLKQKLPDNLASRIVSSEPLAVGWLETRSETEMVVYPQILKIATQLISEAFSNQVITPGHTTTDDVIWWLREQVAQHKMTVWFHPSVSLQRSDNKDFDHLTAFTTKGGAQVIMPGDLLHVDFGITYLRLNTDTQQHAYVLKPCETEAPWELRKAFEAGNRLQDILTSHFEQGLTGNEVLRRARKQAIEEGLKPSIYSHPIGFHGHGAGPAIGMWDNQNGVPHGDYPLYLNTAYSIELNVAQYIESWGKEIRIMLEEDALFDQAGVHYIHGRQTKFHLINSVNQTNQALGLGCGKRVNQAK